MSTENKIDDANKTEVENETHEPKSTPLLTDKQRAEFRFSLDCTNAFYGIRT